MSDAAYRLVAVSRCYGERTVVCVDQLVVRRGEVLGLVGPTGAGKSTLLRLLAAVEPPSAGQLHFGGVRLESGAIPVEVLRRITLVFQRPLLLSGSVRANVEYPLRLRGLPRNSDRVQTVLDGLRL